MDTGPHRGIAAAAALLAGLVLRLWFVRHAPALAGDALVYGGIAKNLLLHGVYGFNRDILPDGQVTYLPTLIRLPGYPLFLAVCFRLFGMENYRAAVYVQVVFDLWTCALAAGLARRLFGARAFPLVLQVAALCPFTANYAATPLTETLVLWTIALAFYGLWRWREEGAGLNRWVWAVGFALTWSLLLRPDQGLLAAAVLPAMGWIAWRAHGRGRRAAGPAMGAALCVLLPLVPWTLRNWRTFHVVQPLAPRSAADPGERPPTGFNLWFRTWGLDFVSTDEVYWNVNGGPIQAADLPQRAFALGCTAGRGARETLPLYGETAALLNDYNVTQNDSPALDARFAGLAQRRFAAAPLCTHLLLPLGRVGDMLVRPRTELLPIPDRWWEPPLRVRTRLLLVLSMALDVAYLAGGIAGLRAGLRRFPQGRPVLWAMLAAVLLRSALLLTLDNSEPRYTLEFFPILFVWVGGLSRAKEDDARQIGEVR